MSKNNKKSKKLSKLIILLSSFFVIIFVAIILALTVRGVRGNPTAEELIQNSWRENGPFELSPERGRFALAYSLSEDKSFHFSLPLARFVTPDLGYINGNYVSLFAPGVSFLLIPGYLLGKSLGISQVGTFAMISLFALGNFIMIFLISRLFNVRKSAAVLGGVIFLFATPAFAYSTTLYQHHVSVFLLLLSLYLLMHWDNFKSLLFIWFICAYSLLVDYPNLLFMFPIGITALLRSVNVKDLNESLKIKLNFSKIISVVSVLLPLSIFLLYNKASYGNVFQLAGTVATVEAIDEAGNPTTPSGSEEEITEESLVVEQQSKVLSGVYEPRDMVNGLFILLFSPDRGIIIFTPVILTGIFGIYFLYKEKNKYLLLLLSISGINLVSYSMWGDPWGGWAFGSRYLIPFYSIFAIFSAIAVDRLSTKKIYITIFSLLLLYSVSVNALGAITTNANPPKIQAIPLQNITGREEKYSFDRNWNYLVDGGSKSFVYNEYLEGKIDSRHYYYAIISMIGIFSFTNIMALYFARQQK